MRRILSVLTALSLIFVSAVMPMSVNAAWSSSDIVGTWKGTHTGIEDDGYGNVNYFERNLIVAIENCDSQGNFTGIVQVSTKPGQTSNGWYNYSCKGAVDFITGDFYMEGINVTESDGNPTWSPAVHEGTLWGDSISGMINDSLHIDRPFNLYRESTNAVKPTVPEHLAGKNNGSDSGGSSSDSNGNWSKASDWAVKELGEAVNEDLLPQIIKGKDLTCNITRAEFAAVAVNLYSHITGVYGVPDTIYVPFTDTNDLDVRAAYVYGIVQGTSATTFSPNDPITREQMATMLTRVVKLMMVSGWTIDKDAAYTMSYPSKGRFADDSRISGYAKDSVYCMAAFDVINGTGNNNFSPQNHATREQAVIIAKRMYGTEFGEMGLDIYYSGSSSSDNTYNYSDGYNSSTSSATDVIYPDGWTGGSVTLTDGYNSSESNYASDIIYDTSSSNNSITVTDVITDVIW